MAGSASRSPSDRPMREGMLYSPRDIELDGERLIWVGQSMRYKHAKPEMLDDFIGLCDAERFSSAVLAYARRWGVLGLCEHGLPSSHHRQANGYASQKPLIFELRGATRRGATCRTSLWPFTTRGHAIFGNSSCKASVRPYYVAFVRFDEGWSLSSTICGPLEFARLNDPIAILHQLISTPDNLQSDRVVNHKKLT